MRHFHTDNPFLCIKATMMGWAISPQCNPEIVEVCSEMIVGDVMFLPDQGALFDELERRGISRDGMNKLQESTFSQ